MGTKLSQDEIIRQFIEVHGNRYGYLKVIYLKRDKNVWITCKIHGDFEQQPGVHLSGSGCPDCAGVAKITKEKVIRIGALVHHGKYNYELVPETLKNIQEKIWAICPIHGPFEVRISNHLYFPNFCGCDKCSTSGFDQTKPAILYYIQDLITGWYKIGITNRSTKDRFSRAKDRYRLIQEQSFDLGSDAKAEEIRLHHLYNNFRVENFTWDKVIGGKTEFFIIDILGLDTPKLLPAP